MEHNVMRELRNDEPVTRSVLVIEGGGWFLESGNTVSAGRFAAELAAARAFMDQVRYPAVDTGPLLEARADGRWYCSVDADGNFEIGGAA